MADRGTLRRLWDIAFTVLLVASVALAVWHDAEDDDATRRAIELVDLGFVALFVVEWLVRVARAPSPGRHALRHAWELLGMVPLMAPVPSMLRALRLLRLVRLLRVFERLGRRLHIWERIAREASLRQILTASAVITVLGSLVVWFLERGHHPDRPALDHYTEWLWWAVVTVTTVGYGDVTPVTASGRMVATVLMVTGIGTIGLLASNIASALVKRGDGEGTRPEPASVVDELARLADLRERGHLTDEEFAEAKRITLAGPPRTRSG